LLKQAFAFDAIGDPVDARILLKKILREHPSSEQAAIAKKKLEILGE
ncbi:MAG: tol-pal system protein YbgF, partial [Proteobacteria bacterium]|nr:tol-pal system protein YbgF [Pseudomonadota bacterium]